MAKRQTAAEKAAAAQEQETAKVQEAVVTEEVKESPTAPEATEAPKAPEAPIVEEKTTKTPTCQVKYLETGESRIFGKLYRYEKGKEDKLTTDVAGILQNSGKLAIIK
jgi:sRNA-binding protein